MQKLKILKCFFFVTACLATGLAGLHASAQSKNETQPNIIYILVDDMGIGDVGVYYQNYRKQQNRRNWPYMQTPFIDKMAAGGAQVNHGYVNSPVCVASRASFLLGATQGHTQVRDNQFDRALDNNYNIANTLKHAGYTTAAIGKWGLQGKSKDWPAHPLKTGFDYYYGYIRHADGHEHYPKEGKYRGVKEVYDGYTNVTPALDKCYTGDLWTARAKQWIVDYTKSKDGNKPFFMYLAYDTPHAVIELPTGPYPAGSGLNGGLQWLGTPGKMINTAAGEIDSWLAPEYASATWDDDNNASTAEVPWPDVNKRYATSIKRIDDQVGDVLQLLKDLGIGENTLVIFTSDNGPSNESYLKENYSPEFFRGYGSFDGIKRDLWEGGIRVPFIVQWPAKIKAGSQVNEPMIASDWLATFLDAAGHSYPANGDGISVLPSLTGNGKRPPSKIYMEYEQPMRTPNYPDFEPSRRNGQRNQMQALRIGNYMGVRYNIQSPDDPFEIYDVVNDPKEKNNLAATAGFERMQQQIQQKAIQMRRPDKDTKRPYDSVHMAHYTGKVSKKEKFTCTLFQSGDAWVPNEYGLKALSAKKLSRLNTAGLPYAGNGVYVVTGYITVPADGSYAFSFKSNGKAVFKLHDALLIDADFGYDGEEKNSLILLKAGRHPFKFYYRPSASNGRFSFTWSGRGFNNRDIVAF